jgi:glycosyltransferase involved in cell wall biosynthesis
MVVDELFPTEVDFPSDMVRKYYGLLHSDNVQVLGIPNRIRESFKKISGVEPGHLPQLFDLNDVVAEQKDGQYITQVNTHPIKGIQVFDEVAKLLPEKRFLVVENWVDTPRYEPACGNIKLSPIFKNPRDLYSQTRILLVPSLCNEGASRVAVEAMLNGIPVIAHRIGSLPEIGNGHMQFIDPPSINGYELRGTIMYPIINKEELLDVARRFASKILEIDTNHNEFANHSKMASINYCQGQEAQFRKLLSTWT